MTEIENKIIKALDEIRHFLQEDGGDIEFVRYEEETKVCELRFLGECVTCPVSVMTLRAGIERHLIDSIPEIKRVESVK